MNAVNPPKERQSHADTDGLQQASVLSVLLEFWIVLYETIEKFH
jgi:hypothetical protein